MGGESSPQNWPNQPAYSTGAAYAPNPAYFSKKNSGKAITSLVLGIVSLVIFGIILGILAVVFGSLAYRDIGKNPASLKGRGMAIAGLVLGIIGFVAAIILIVFLETYYPTP